LPCTTTNTHLTCPTDLFRIMGGNGANTMFETLIKVADDLETDYP
jgi:hypothetical protein